MKLRIFSAVTLILASMLVAVCVFGEENPVSPGVSIEMKVEESSSQVIGGDLEVLARKMVAEKASSFFKCQPKAELAEKRKINRPGLPGKSR